MSDTFVVIGGDAAGMSAASKAKRENSEIDVTVFEKGRWVSYAACGMPYYVKGEVDELNDLVAVTPEEFREERDIDLRTGHVVVGINPVAETVTVDAQYGEFVALARKYDSTDGVGQRFACPVPRYSKPVTTGGADTVADSNLPRLC